MKYQLIIFKLDVQLNKMIMKKVIVGLFILFFGCQEKDEIQTDTLADTQWITPDQLMNDRLGGENILWLKFNSNGFVDWEHTRNDTVISTESVEYTAIDHVIKIRREGGVFTFDQEGDSLISRDLKQLDGEWRTYILVAGAE